MVDLPQVCSSILFSQSLVKPGSPVSWPVAPWFFLRIPLYFNLVRRAQKTTSLGLGRQDLQKRADGI